MRRFGRAVWQKKVLPSDWIWDISPVALDSHITLRTTLPTPQYTNSQGSQIYSSIKFFIKNKKCGF